MSDVSATKDFKRLTTEGHRAGSSLAIGRGFCLARDAIARGLVGLGVTPNMLTAAGAVCTFGAAGCLLFGASADWEEVVRGGRTPWTLYGAILLFLASAFDMLDGAVARIGGQATPFGGVLDSTLDRSSDMAVYLAISAHFTWHGNLTYALLAMVALCNSTLVSYVKARAETVIPDCSVGYWLRGERSAALLIAAFSMHLPAVLWQQALLPALTVVRRFRWTYQVIAAQAAKRSPPDAGPFSDGRRYVALWRFPRGSIPYDVVTGVNILFILAAPWISPVFLGSADPLRQFLTRG